MIELKTYKVTVKKGDEIEDIEINAVNEYDAKKKAIETFYYDGWHVVGVS